MLDALLKLLPEARGDGRQMILDLLAIALKVAHEDLSKAARHDWDVLLEALKHMPEECMAGSGEQRKELVRRITLAGVELRNSILALKDDIKLLTEKV